MESVGSYLLFVELSAIREQGQISIDQDVQLPVLVWGGRAAAVLPVNQHRHGLEEVMKGIRSLSLSRQGHGQKRLAHGQAPFFMGHL